MRWINNTVKLQILVAVGILFLAAAVLSAQQGNLPYAVVLDAAHGGIDSGARLQPGLDEKTFALNLATSLATQLQAHSIPVTLTRNADADITGDARAESMNHAQAAACLSLHATASGNGVHLFTSALPQGADSGAQRSFHAWKTAQSSLIQQSLRLESEVNTALEHEQIPVLMGRTTLMPLESATCPAMVVEVAPRDASTPITDAKYQQQIVDALVAALTAWSTDWRMQP